MYQPTNQIFLSLPQTCATKCYFGCIVEQTAFSKITLSQINEKKNLLCQIKHHTSSSLCCDMAHICQVNSRYSTQMRQTTHSFNQTDTARVLFLKRALLGQTRLLPLLFLHWWRLLWFCAEKWPHLNLKELQAVALSNEIFLFCFVFTSRWLVRINLRWDLLRKKYLPLHWLLRRT